MTEPNEVPAGPGQKEPEGESWTDQDEVRAGADRRSPWTNRRRPAS